MNQTNNAKLSPNARNLRKNMTKEERNLWYDFLKTLPLTVHRQKTMGQYIVDFYVATEKLVIELDGSQHYEETGQAKDAERDRYLKSIGCNSLFLKISRVDLSLYRKKYFVSIYITHNLPPN